MTVPATVEVFDLRTPLEFQLSAETPVVVEPLDAHSLRGRARSGRRDDSWRVTFSNEDRLGIERALSIWESSGYGALPIRWEPPNRSATSVVIDVPDGFRSSMTGARHGRFSITLTEAR